MLENKFAKYTASVAFEKLDQKMIRIIKRNILDSYAGIFGSLRDVVMIRKYDRLASMVQDENGISVWGVGQKAHVAETIFMNTILGRRSDLLNTYMSPDKMGASHPSDNVSLVLSVTDWLNKNGKDLLTYTYAAYQLSGAFADYYDPEKRGYDHDAVALFYTPLIIGLMMGLSVDELTESQRIAGMMGIDINQSAMGEVTDWKHCTYASCAMRGMQAVFMALAGFKGAKDIYGGEAGVDRFLPHSRAAMEPMPDIGTVIFKRWPALVFCQTPIDVAIDIAQKIEDPMSIDNVQVYIYKKAIDVAAIESAYKPISRAGRTHSLPYCVAAALAKKTIEYDYFNDDFIDREKEVAGLVRKIRVYEDKRMTLQYPDGAPCKIIVTLKGGTAIEGSRKYPHGDPHDPLSDEEIEKKASAYLTHFISGKEAKTVIERIWGLEKESSIDWLVEPLKRRII
jgi:2-methylcitrate dehydratase